MIHNDATTNILFTIKYGNNCVLNDVVHVVVHPLPVINAVVDIPRAKYEEEVQLDVISNSILHYNWLPTTLVNIDTIKNPTSIITASTLFTVNVKDKNNCENTDTVFVELIDECQENFIYVPTAFSPNNDGLNDCFGIVSPPKLSDFKLVIFDRWGEKIFESTDKNTCWDGKHNGVDAMTDSYPYIISYKCYNGVNLSKKGIITIIR
jgi:gliding motility-associated-like protein